MKIRCSAVVKDPIEREFLKDITGGFIISDKVLVEIEGGLDKFHDLAVLFEDFPDHALYLCSSNGLYLVESEEVNDESPRAQDTGWI